MKQGSLQQNEYMIYKLWTRVLGKLQHTLIYLNVLFKFRENFTPNGHNFIYHTPMTHVQSPQQVFSLNPTKATRLRAGV